MQFCPETEKVISAAGYVFIPEEIGPQQEFSCLILKPHETRRPIC
jgi:hypothetical protein